MMMNNQIQAMLSNRRSFVVACIVVAQIISLFCGSYSSAGYDAAPPGSHLTNPRIVVKKSKRLLTLYDAGREVRKYRVGLGLSPIEDKIRAGDRRTPEGEFYICSKNSHSQFYLSLGISYPNREHSERGLRDGLITRAQYNQIVLALNRGRVPLQNTRLGGEIFIHGNGSTSDWTWGCVALDDNDVKELFDAVPIGTPVTIQH